MVVMAHNSAGPRDDILQDKQKQKYGFLCEDSTYLQSLNEIYAGLSQGGSKKTELLEKVETGRNRLKNMVSNEAFARMFYEEIQALVKESK